LDSLKWEGLRIVLPAWPGDHLIAFTSEGRAARVETDDVAPLTDAPATLPDRSWRLKPRERLSAATSVGVPPRFWTIVTRKGHIQRVVQAALDRQMGRDVDVVKSPHRNDPPVSVDEGERGDALVITRWGSYVRFPQHAIEVRGSQAIDLEPGDQVVGVLSLADEDHILVLTASGYVMHRDAQQLKGRVKPGGAGKGLIQSQDVIGTFRYQEDAYLICLTFSGKLLMFPTSDIPCHTRHGKGTLLHNLKRDPIITAALVMDAT
jgi:DNA gyrase/topoisomerase IV subunit A